MPVLISLGCCLEESPGELAFDNGIGFALDFGLKGPQQNLNIYALEKTFMIRPKAAYQHPCDFLVIKGQRPEPVRSSVRHDRLRRDGPHGCGKDAK